MKYQALKWEVLGNPERPEEKCIGVITMNRPEALNAVDVRMRVELDILCDEIANNSHIKVVILTGAGRGFCAGGDLKSEAGPVGALDEDFDFGDFGPYKELAGYFFNDLRHEVLQRAFRKLEDLPPVVIAAINGPAVGIGLEMCTLCDIRYASDRARLGEVAVPAGFLPESGGARNLPKLVGIGRAMELIMTGRIIDADEAERIGLVERVVPASEIDRAVDEWVESIVRADAKAIRLQKELIREWERLPLEEAIVAGIEVFANAYDSDAPVRRAQSFLDRRAESKS